MVKFGRKLELINVQQAGKKEINKVLKQEAMKILLKSLYLAKKGGKKKNHEQRNNSKRKQIKIIKN
jgi:hypothetical protein